MMHTAVRDRRQHWILFTGLVVAVYSAALSLAGWLPYLDRAGAVAAGMTVDMVVVVPAAFYFLVVRRRGLPILTLVPVVVLSVVAASRVLPTDRQQLLSALEHLAAPAELAILGWIAWRSAKALGRARQNATADPYEQLRQAAYEVTGSHLAASVLASELAVLYYAFGSWRARPHVPEGASGFTHHLRSGHSGIVLGFLVIVASEGLAMHLLLLRWSALAAWIFTIGSVYSALWVIGDYRATALRPILVTDESIVIRAGFRYVLEVPRESIVEVGRERPDFGRKSRNLTLLSTPTRWLTLSRPMLAEGPYGIRRPVRAVGIEPDDPEAFDRALEPRQI